MIAPKPSATRNSVNDPDFEAADGANSPDAASRELPSGETHRPRFQTFDELMPAWKEDLNAGRRPIRYTVGTGELAKVEIGPGRVTLLGGAPCAGKTALVMQCVVDGLRLTDSLKALVVNVEMAPQVLLDRQLARISGIDLTTIRSRLFEPEHRARLDSALDAINRFSKRLGFVRPPYDLPNVSGAIKEFCPHLIVLDYIQRIVPGERHADKRSAVDALMTSVRKLADDGLAVIVVAAMARTRSAIGNAGYDAKQLGLGSFRESSELEYGADDAYVLAPASPGDELTLRHLKARYGEQQDLSLHFDRSLQRFESLTALPAGAKVVSKPAVASSRKTR